jgi:SAM-dependent methyltransferase
MKPAPPTNSKKAVVSEKARWEGLFQGTDFYYGHEPGPVARRAVKYHRALTLVPGLALDAGCGEGQDLVFLAQRGYKATGIDLTEQGTIKTRRLLKLMNQTAEVMQGDILEFSPMIYDLVLAVNCLQFLGVHGAATLQRLMQAVKPGGIIGLSLFAQEKDQAEVENTIWRTTLPDLLHFFADWQLLETANLWQWNMQTDQPQAFATLIAQRKEGAPQRKA